MTREGPPAHKMPLPPLSTGPGGLARGSQSWQALSSAAGTERRGFPPPVARLCFPISSQPGVVKGTDVLNSASPGFQFRLCPEQAPWPQAAYPLWGRLTGRPTRWGSGPHFTLLLPFMGRGLCCPARLCARDKDPVQWGHPVSMSHLLPGSS